MSADMGAWIAQVAFWALLIWGIIVGELQVRSTTVMISLWLLGFLGISHMPFVPFASFVALLDIVLVFLVFKGDVRLT